MHFYSKCLFDLFKEQLYPFWTLAKIILCNSDEPGFLSDCPSLMLGIAIHSQAMLERGVCIPVNLSEPHCRRSPAIQNERAGDLARRLFWVEILVHKKSKHMIQT